MPPAAARLQQGLGLVDARGVTKGWQDRGDYSPGRVPGLRPQCGPGLSATSLRQTGRRALHLSEQPPTTPRAFQGAGGGEAGHPGECFE